jgi:hypothetical protein
MRAVLQEAESKLRQFGQLYEAERERLKAQRYIAEFEPGSRWLALSLHPVELGGAQRWLGVVAGADQRPIPFFTWQNASALSVGEPFVALADRLVPAGQYAAAQQTGATRLLTAAAAPAKSRHSMETALFSLQALEVEEHSDADLPYLQMTSGADTGKRFPLRFAVNTIGRGSANTITLSDPGASREHAEIAFAAGNFVLRDKNSTNHTLRNGERIAEAVLHLGDTVRFADTEAIFSLAGFELMQTDSKAAVAALEKTLRHCPDFIPALRTLAFLLERDVVRQGEARPIWERLKALESRS